MCVRYSISLHPNLSFRLVGPSQQVATAIKLLYHRIGLRGDKCSENLIEPLPIVTLGRNGAAGVLESPMALADGKFQQVAEVKSEYIGRIVGAKSTNISVIMEKSGADIQILKSDFSRGTTKMLLLGNHQNVLLASQLIQEVLVNGMAKISKLPALKDDS